MILRLAKGKNGDPPTLTCMRDDGTTTWQRSSAWLAQHDLTHYAVETTLGYHEAFLGLVAGGRDLDSFGTRDGVRDSYTREERWAEEIAGAVQFPGISGGGALSDLDLWELLGRSCRDRGVARPPVTPEELACVRRQAQALYQRWAGTHEGDTLELVFP